MKLDDLRSGDLINFDMITPGIFDSQYKSVIVAGIFDYLPARVIDPELQVKHDGLYTYFKDKVNNVNDMTVYKYLAIQPNKDTSELLVIGFPWIREDTLQITQGRKGTCLISNWQQSFEAPFKDFLNNLGATYVLRIDDN